MKNLSSHDGLHDALTGALTLQAFYEAVEREIARARRDSINLYLLLLKLSHPIQNTFADTEFSNPNKNSVEREILLVQLVELVHALKSSLRINDLISRTALSEISVVFSGNADELKKRVLETAKNFSAEVAMVQYQENWKLPDFLMAGDMALNGTGAPKNVATN
jgi:PleD family two-component response regulator